jgi:succinyl-diaminopimelate desuccinylase
MGEETGEPGTKTLLAEIYGGDYAVVLEPTGFRTATFTKGMANYEITVSGTPSHASRPDQGTNAISDARAVLAALAAYDRRLRGRTDPRCGRAYATVTAFESGTDSNMGVLPGEARLVLDRRILPEESPESVDAEVESVVSEAGKDLDSDLSLKPVQRYAPSSIPIGSPLATRFRDVSAAVADAPTDP